MNKNAYILLSLGAGAVVGCAIGYLAKRHYEKWAIDEIDRSDEAWAGKLSREYETLDVTIREIYELREACKIILDAGQYETILEQVRYKMKSINESNPELRTSIEDYINICERRLQKFQKENDKDSAASMVEALGYVTDGDEPFKGTRLYGKEKQEAKRKRRVIPRDDSMDDGSDEFDDMPALTPNGDIADEDEEEVTWTTDAKDHVSGDDIVRDEPYIITEWQFTYGKLDYDKVSLQYLCLDDTVLDEDDSEFDQSFIGEDNLLAFETDDCESIFIRNDQLQIDYEIMWVEGSYIRDVLGYRELPQTVGRRIWRSWEKRED